MGHVTTEALAITPSVNWSHLAPKPIEDQALQQTQRSKLGSAHLLRAAAGQDCLSTVKQVSIYNALVLSRVCFALMLDLSNVSAIA
jgi:hypothetical protein